ncbi:hypothetical protein FQ192_29110 [Pseudomonas sp. ANT_J12]|nr:hypothetical protein FQ192_29110 [Pseudomonas sp. ANT_J12]
MTVPTHRVGMPLVTLRVTLWDAERPWLHSHAERGNDQHDQRRDFTSTQPCTAPHPPHPSAHTNTRPAPVAHRGSAP